MIEVKQIVEPLDLGGYDAAYAGQTALVWVNLPAALRQKRAELLRGFARQVAAQMKGAKKITWLAWFAEQRRRFSAAPADAMETLMAAVWSAGADAETHWTVAEINKLQEADPLLYAWMTRQSWLMIDAWQEARKKK